MTLRSPAPSPDDASAGVVLQTTATAGNAGNTPGRLRAARILSVVGALLAVLPIGAVWFRLSTQTTASSGGISTTTHRSMIASEGWTVLVPFVALMVIAMVPVLLLTTSLDVQRVRVWSAALFGVGVALALMTIGAFYLPALVALVAAARYGRNGAHTR